MTAMSPSFQSVGMFPSSNHMVFISWWSMVVEVSRSACRASDGMSSGPAALPRQSVQRVCGWWDLYLLGRGLSVEQLLKVFCPPSMLFFFGGEESSLFGPDLGVCLSKLTS